MPSTSPPAPFPDGPLARITRIAAVLERAAASNEELGRLTPEVVDHLHEARLFRLLLPRAYDGEEVDLPTWFCAMEALAKLDASTAWCVGQINGCAAAACALAPTVARTIWGDRRAALSWGPPVTARAEAVAGGHRLSGEWGMASGSRHASWLGLMAPIVDASGKPEPQSDGMQLRTFLVPAGNVTFIDNWQVHGLIATNSGGYSVRDLFVPHGYSVNRLQVLDSTLPSPLYKFPLNSFFSLGFSAVALGTARSLLDAALALAGEKRPRLARLALRDNHAVQLQIGEAEARLRSARGYVAATAERVWAQTVASGTLEVAQPHGDDICHSRGQGRRRRRLGGGRRQRDFRARALRTPHARHTHGHPAAAGAQVAPAGSGRLSARPGAEPDVCLTGTGDGRRQAPRGGWLARRAGHAPAMPTRCARGRACRQGWNFTSTSAAQTPTWRTGCSAASNSARGAKFTYLPMLPGGVFKRTNNQPPMVQFKDVAANRNYQQLEIARFIGTHVASCA